MANKAIDAIGKKLKAGGLLDDKRLQPVVDAVNKVLKAIKPYLAPLAKGLEKLRTAFVMADQGPGALAALGFVKKAYDEFIKLLKKNADAAKKKLQSLADKAKTALPTVGSLIKPVLDGLADAGEFMIGELAHCKDKLLGFTGPLLTGAFTCMKDAVVRGIASGAFESFLKLLRTNMAQAKAKLTSLVGKLAVFFPQAKSLAGPIVTALDSVGDAVVDGAGLCKGRITGLNKETAQGLLACLGEAVKSAGLAVVRGLARGFEQLWRKSCRAAMPKLEQMGTLISRVFFALAPVVKQVTARLKRKCEGG